MGVVTRRDSPFYWLNIERPGLPPLRESTRILARGLPPPLLRENRQLAEQVYATRLADLARARHGLAVERPRTTFRAFAAWYLDHVTPTKRTAAREASAVRTLVAFFGRLELATIDHALAREYVTTRRRAVKPATVNREVDVLKSMLTSAVPRYLERNPLLGMKRLRARSPEPRVLSHEEERRLLAALETPAQRALVIGALDTLVRLSDLVGLRWSQDRGDHLEIPDPKTAPYKVPVSRRFRLALDALARSSAFVFSGFHHGRGARPSQNAVIRMFRAACAAADVPYGRPDGVTWHALRHTGATRAIAAGASLRDLMALGGWRDLKSVLRYTRPTGVDRALVDRMSRPARSMHARRAAHGKC